MTTALNRLKAIFLLISLLPGGQILNTNSGDIVVYLCMISKWNIASVIMLAYILGDKSDFA